MQGPFAAADSFIAVLPQPRSHTDEIAAGRGAPSFPWQGRRVNELACRSSQGSQKETCVSQADGRGEEQLQGIHYRFNCRQKRGIFCRLARTVSPKPGKNGDDARELRGQTSKVRPTIPAGASRLPLSWDGGRFRVWATKGTTRPKFGCCFSACLNDRKLRRQDRKWRQALLQKRP